MDENKTNIPEAEIKDGQLDEVSGGLGKESKKFTCCVCQDRCDWAEESEVACVCKRCYSLGLYDLWLKNGSAENGLNITRPF